MPVISDLVVPVDFSLLLVKYRVVRSLSRYIGAKSARRELNILACFTMYRVLGFSFCFRARVAPRRPSLASRSSGAYSRNVRYALMAGPYLPSICSERPR